MLLYDYLEPLFRIAFLSDEHYARRDPHSTSIQTLMGRQHSDELK